MELNDEIRSLKGIGDSLATLFGRLGIFTIQDLIYNYPRRYEDYSKITLIRSLKPGEVTIEAAIKQQHGRYVRRGMHITEAIASDESGSVRIVWFNQPWRVNSIKKGEPYFISGKFELSYGHLTLLNPSIELKSVFPVNTARIVPIYKETKGLTSKQIRNAVQKMLPIIRTLQDPLPPDIVARYLLMTKREALEQIHFPESMKKLDEATYRLGFEEIFQLSLASLLNKKANEKNTAPEIQFKESLAVDFVKHLPFKLTDSQRKVIWQIYLDLQKSSPMNRLVEGDVGSGKTVVAAMAALMAIEQNLQVAFMAPTELLARQHAETIYQLLSPLHKERAVGLLVGSMSKAQKSKIKSSVKKNQTKFLIGTHALIQEDVDMHNLALVIIDEQHRFGVQQRRLLLEKAGHMPHVLSLTATPIPRSLALTVFGELDISRITSKPTGRLPIVTKLISPNSQKQAYDQMKDLLKSGKQMFVVCPIIKDSGLIDAVSVESTYEQIANHEFKDWNVGLLHGKLKDVVKQEIMDAFIQHKLDILVATTVIEVGVDVKDASIMLIESPERFGLAQLHQLRGRIGRSSDQGFCYLFLSDSQKPSRRLKELERSNNGFALADLDLQLRGPGAIYGIQQHGALDLRLTSFTNVNQVKLAKEAAVSCINTKVNLLQYKELMTQVKRLQSVTNLN